MPFWEIDNKKRKKKKERNGTHSINNNIYSPTATSYKSTRRESYLFLKTFKNHFKILIYIYILF